MGRAEEGDDRDDVAVQYVESRGVPNMPSRTAWQPPDALRAAPSVWPPLGALAMQTARPKTQAASANAASSSSNPPSCRPKSASPRRRPPSLATTATAVPRPSSASGVATRAVRRNLARSSAAWAAALASDPVVDDGAVSSVPASESVHATSCAIGSSAGGSSAGGSSASGTTGDREAQRSAGFYDRDGVPHPVALRRSIVTSEAVDVEAALADLGIDYAGLQADPAAAGRVMSAADLGPRLMDARNAGTDREPPAEEALRAEIFLGTFVSRPKLAEDDRERWLDAATRREAEQTTRERNKGVDDDALRRMAGVRRDVGVPLQLFDDEQLEVRTPHEWMALATPRPNEVEWLGKRVPTDARVLATRRREERAEAARRVQAAQRGTRARQEYRRRAQLSRQRAAEKLAKDGALQLRMQARRRRAKEDAPSQEAPESGLLPIGVEQGGTYAGTVMATIEYGGSEEGDTGDNGKGIWRVRLCPCLPDPAGNTLSRDGGHYGVGVAETPAVEDAPAAAPRSASTRAKAAVAAFAASGAQRASVAAGVAAGEAGYDEYADMVFTDAATGILRPLGGGQLQGKALLWYAVTLRSIEHRAHSPHIISRYQR